MTTTTTDAYAPLLQELDRLFPDEDEWPHGLRPVIVTEASTLEGADIDDPEGIAALQRGDFVVVGGMPDSYISSAHRPADARRIVEALREVPADWMPAFERNARAPNPWSVLERFAR